MLNFILAVLSVIPFPEKERISLNLACNAGSKLEASTSSNSSRIPSAFGREKTMLVELVLTAVNKYCCMAVRSASNNLKLVGMEGFGAILPIGIGAGPCSVQKLFCCAKVCRNVKRMMIVNSVSFLIMRGR